MSGDLSRTEDPVDLAAEYALGLLTGDELATARQLHRESSSFRSDVARWHGRLAPLADEVQSIPAPASAWRAIEARIGATEGGDNVVFLRRRVGQWRAATAAMTALAACLALLLLVRPWPVGVEGQAPVGGQPPMVAMLGSDPHGMKVVASWDPAGHQLVLAVPGDMPESPGHSHELWVIPSGGKPRSLGTMPAGRQMHMKLANALADLLQEGATIAISIEPKGGSPTGQPTGPVVAAGALKSA